MNEIVDDLPIESESIAARSEETTELARIEDAVRGEVDDLLKQATSATVSTDVEAQTAADFVIDCRRRTQRIKEWFAPLVDAAHRAHRLLCDRRADAIGQYAEPERIVDEKLRRYRREQEMARREAERQAAETARIAAEELQLAAALRAESAGNSDRAEAILQAPTPPVLVPPVDAPPPMKPKGLGFREKWTVEIIDADAFVRWCAENLVDRRQYLLPNESELNRLATRLKGEIRVNGVRIICDVYTQRDSRR